MAMKMEQDRPRIEQVFARGIVRDTQRAMIPQGGVYDSTDYLFEQPGRIYKRGGWKRHSAALGASTTTAAVATIHIPTRVVAVADGILYDVTSEITPENILVDTCFEPIENPPLYVDRLIFCDPTGAAGPKKVYATGPAGDIAIADLGGSPPGAVHSTVYASRIVLARSADDASQMNRIWFSPLPDVESTWDTTNTYIDATHEITGLASVQGVLLIFSPTHIERILGGIPPGVEGENMELQPAAGVGCLDARSIVDIGGEVIFAGEGGVWATSGADARSLTEKDDGTGIQSYWRTLFEEHEVRQLIGGLLSRDFYIISVLDEENALIDTLICHLPTLAWGRHTNMAARMYAVGGTEENSLDLYAASAVAGYVNKLRTILEPSASVKNDEDGAPVSPSLTFRTYAEGPGLKAWGHGHLTYDLRDAATDNPTLAVGVASGIEATSFGTVKTLAETADATRKRFKVNRDAQAVTVKLTQTGASSKTELFALEVDMRSYDQPSEGV